MFIKLGFSIRFIRSELAEGIRNICIIYFINESQDWSRIGEVYEIEKVDKQPRVMWQNKLYSSECDALKKIKCCT